MGEYRMGLLESLRRYLCPSVRDNDRVIRLVDAVSDVFDDCVPGGDLVPRDGLTFCNFAVRRVLHAYGYRHLDDMLANDMVAFMEASDHWCVVDMEAARLLANRGRVVVAGRRGEPNGHVAVLRPGLPDRSAKWDSRDVPKVMNVGKDLRLGAGANWAFRDRPTFYLLDEKFMEV
jgi:hypothetical protein